jgi:hypothetical protein
VATYTELAQGKITEQQAVHRVLGKYGGTGANRYTKNRDRNPTSVKLTIGRGKAYELARLERDSATKPHVAGFQFWPDGQPGQRFSRLCACAATGLRSISKSQLQLLQWR